MSKYTVNPYTLNRHYDDGAVISGYEAQLLEDLAIRWNMRGRFL